MKYFFTGTFILLLSGCACDPVVKIQTQEVMVPVSVPCKAVVPQKPDYNFDKATADQSIFDKTKALLADRKLSAGYEEELVAALKSCNNKQNIILFY